MGATRPVGSGHDGARADAGTGPIFSGKVFPFVFITIACGALSGFHALVSSGTTPKLVSNEGDIRLAGYGSMAVESFVAIMAVIAASWKEDGRLAKPGVVGTVMSNLGLERYLGGLGLTLERTPVGEASVVAGMRAANAVIGGEAAAQFSTAGRDPSGERRVCAESGTGIASPPGGATAAVTPDSTSANGHPSSFANAPRS